MFPEQIQDVFYLNITNLTRLIIIIFMIINFIIDHLIN